MQHGGHKKLLLPSVALGGSLLLLLLLLVPPGAEAFNLAQIGRQQQAQAQAAQGQQQRHGQGQGLGQPTDRGVGLGERVPRRVRSVRGIRCPACLSADSDELVLFLEDTASASVSPLLNDVGRGRGRGEQQAAAALMEAVEGLPPSEQALYLYAHKPWIAATGAASTEEGERGAELAAMAEAAAARWAS